METLAFGQFDTGNTFPLEWSVSGYAAGVGRLQMAARDLWDNDR